MLLPRLLLAAVAGAVLADAPGLRVLRVSPSGDAAPTAAIAVTFDRPVAGSLDRSVDPARVLEITPAIPGRLEWRDPVTLQLRPAAPLAAGAEYTVTVRDDFAAMDGSRLERPYRFTFRVRGPRVLAGWPVNAGLHPRHLTPDATFELVLDAPVDPAAVRTAAFVELDGRCVAPDTKTEVVRLRVVEQRPLSDDDRWEFREAGGWDRDRAADPLRRVIRVAPDTPLPLACAGTLVLPHSFDARDGTGSGVLQRWDFATYGPFRLATARCSYEKVCPTGPAVVSFSTPVRGADVLRHVALLPRVPFTITDTADTRDTWVLEAELRPRTTYAIVADTALRDAFGQRLGGNPAAGLTTTGFAPAINYTYGRATVERNGFRTLGVTHVNVDTLEVVAAPIPRALEWRFLTTGEWGWQDLLDSLAPAAERRRIAVRNERDRVRAFGVPMPAPDARRRVAGADSPTLYAVRVTSPQLGVEDRRRRPVALVQVTDLGVNAKIGAGDGVVWVTGASDGRPRGGATVTLHDSRGRVLATARSDSSGLARLTDYRTPPRAEGEAERQPWEAFEGYVAVALGEDRAVVGVNEFDPDLGPWQFNVNAAWGGDRIPAAGAVFTERGIYRPGEPLYAKAIVRAGLLGRLAPPAPGDSLRWIFRDREGNALEEATVALSAFGTAERRWHVPTDAKLGDYQIATQLRRQGAWTDLAWTSYRVAEYRPPEFLVDIAADTTARRAGDSLRAGVEARYLFGAPMVRAAVSWTVRERALESWELEVPNTEGFHLGEGGWWYEELQGRRGGITVVASETDTLDAAGRLEFAVRLPETERATRATLQATVTDVNRQTVSAATSLTVHPADFYIAARPDGKRYFWTAGTPQQVSVIAVRPDGARVPGVRVTGAVVRREWHQVRRERGGYAELVGEWVSDTVARCALTTAPEPVPCRFTPPAGGTYIVGFSASDARGRAVATSLYRWATGSDWVPWNDESQFKMDVIPDRTRYSVGDTATVLFASPFTDAEAWITLEREGLIEQRRLRVTSGTTTLRLPVTEALAPNAFVSIVVARGRSAPPGTLDDPGRPTIRVGYAELRVTPERKRLAVEAEPVRPEYRPGDTARVRLRVRDAAGRGQRSEVTLWAVDEGVLALTGYRTPDPIDLIYQPRGLGMRLGSNLASVAPQVPEGEKGRRAPGGGGGQAGNDILRSRFQTTAFFLGSIVTDAEGNAVAAAKLPDNLTTFRLMAVAVTAGDRYGSGQSKLLVTRPLVARPALPRFVREGDRLAAGVVVNHRLGGTPQVKVTAAAAGARLAGATSRTTTLAAGRGTEVRFDIRAPARAMPDDSVAFRFDASSDDARDAVRVDIPVRPASPPRAMTIAGVLTDTASVELTLPADVDPARSRLTLSQGTSPLAIVRGARQWFRAYPYLCTEQLSSGARPLIALYRANRALNDSAARAEARTQREQIEQVVGTLRRRQRPDGGIGFWSAEDWSTPWLSAYAGQTLLDARAAGIAVDDTVLARLAGYLNGALATQPPVFAPVAWWYGDRTIRLSDHVMAVDFLSRLGRRNRAAENELLRQAPQLAWEDRVKLAEVLARGGERGDRAAARKLLEAAWALVRVEGRRAVLPDDALRRQFYFASATRPAAYLLTATLAVDSAHPLVGPLVETLVQQGRADAHAWNTQDFGAAVAALLEVERLQRSAPPARLKVTTARGRELRDSTVPLEGLLERGAKGTARLRLSLAREAAVGAGARPLYFYLTVTEISRAPAVTPDERGLRVERWYEDYETGRPIVRAAAGDLVRVRLRLTAPADRQMVVLDDPLPAGLEAVDLSLRTAGELPGPGAPDSTAAGPGDESGDAAPFGAYWAYGSWDAGWWSPFDHREIRDDRVVWFATVLWKGSYTATYVARATTPGVFAKPPAHAEEMYNPGVNGRSDGGTFTVDAR